MLKDLMWTVLIGVVLALLIAWLVFRFQPDPDPARGGFLSWLGDWARERRESWIDWRDRPRGAGPGGAIAEPDATPASPPVPMPPPPPAPGRRLASVPEAVTGPIPAGSGAAQGDILSLIGALVSEASYGPLPNVRRVVGTLAAVYDAAGRGAQHLGQRLAEPDKDYGPEIWEPMVAAGHQGSAAAMHLATADANLASLGRTTLDEIAASPRRAPHNSQLNGGA